MQFEFATSGRIIFGSGVFDRLGALAEEFLADGPRRAMLVAGLAGNVREAARARLADAGIATTVLEAAGEPTTELAERGAALARAEGCRLVIGLGGGSALDTAKAVAALATNAGPVEDYLEVIGRARPLTRAPLPCIAVPTTAGTGSEVTRNAVLASPAHRVKVSLRSPSILPRVALVDPDLTLDLPPEVTASTGLDALTQLIEPYVCTRANPLTDALCLEGIRRAAGSLGRAFRDGRDAKARRDMAVASLFGGLALANAGLGAVHGFAAPIGGMFSAPHGAVCAALLPHVMSANVEALRRRAPDSPALERYRLIAAMLTGDDRAEAEDGIAWVRRTCVELGIPPLGQYGLSVADVPLLVERAAVASSMKANPVTLTAGELEAILRAAM